MIEARQFTIENTDETSRGDYFVHRIMKVTSAKVIIIDIQLLSCVATCTKSLY